MTNQWAHWPLSSIYGKNFTEIQYATSFEGYSSQSQLTEIMRYNCSLKSMVWQPTSKSWFYQDTSTIQNIILPPLPFPNFFTAKTSLTDINKQQTEAYQTLKLPALQPAGWSMKSPLLVHKLGSLSLLLTLVKQQLIKWCPAKGTTTHRLIKGLILRICQKRRVFHSSCILIVSKLWL